MFSSYTFGDDPTFLASLAIGGKGSISVISNIFPEAWVSLYKAAEANNIKQARRIHHILMPLVENLFIETNPCPTKAILHHQGLIENSFRFPLAPISSENYTKVTSLYNLTKKATK